MYVCFTDANEDKGLVFCQTTVRMLFLSIQCLVIWYWQGFQIELLTSWVLAVICYLHRGVSFCEQSTLLACQWPFPVFLLEWDFSSCTSHMSGCRFPKIPLEDVEVQCLPSLLFCELEILYFYSPAVFLLLMVQHQLLLCPTLGVKYLLVVVCSIQPRVDGHISGWLVFVTRYNRSE